MPILLKHCQKIAEERTLPNSFYEATITLMTKTTHTHTHTHTHTQPRKLQANITDEHRYKNPQQNFSNKIQQHIKKFIHHYQVGFIPGMEGFFNIYKSISVIYHINKLKDKNHMIISIDAKKPLTKFSTHL